jgi:MIP family channel proteins
MGSPPSSCEGGALADPAKARTLVWRFCGHGVRRCSTPTKREPKSRQQRPFVAQGKHVGRPAAAGFEKETAGPSLRGRRFGDNKVEAIEPSNWRVAGLVAGLAVGKRFPWVELVPYIIAQVVGALAAGGVLYVIASGKDGFSLTGGFASNGYGAHSPGGYSLVACFVAEVVLTFFFLLIIHGATDTRVPGGFAGIAIGLGLTLIHLIGIPVTNLSVNPARSTGPAIFVGGWAVQQLWLFWVAPIVGGALGGLVYNGLFEERK